MKTKSIGRIFYILQLKRCRGVRERKGEAKSLDLKSHALKNKNFNKYLDQIKSNQIKWKREKTEDSWKKKYIGKEDEKKKAIKNEDTT